MGIKTAEVQEQLRVLLNRAKRRVMALENAIAQYDYYDAGQLAMQASVFLGRIARREADERKRAKSSDMGWGAGMEALEEEWGE